MKKLGQFEPAFPASRELQEMNRDCEGWNIGMSKRFYAALEFSKNLLNGLAATSNYSIRELAENHCKRIVEVGYYFADELLKQENE